MKIALAETKESIERCFKVIKQLRPHLVEGEFIDLISKQKAQGYVLAYIEHNGEVAAALGFRISDFLARGKCLYIDDLITCESARKKGFGKALLDWSIDIAKREGCHQVHLDSGHHRYDAHRLYLDQGFHITSHHFSMSLKPF